MRVIRNGKIMNVEEARASDKHLGDVTLQTTDGLLAKYTAYALAIFLTLNVLHLTGVLKRK